MALNMESCSREEACVSLGESEKSFDKLLEILRDWLKLQPHLPQDVPERILEHCILGSKMSLERAKRRLDMFYTMKKIVPEILADRDPRGPGLTHLHGLLEMAFLPKLTPDKYRVLIVRVCGDDYRKHLAFDSIKYAIMMEEILLHECRALGNIFVLDNSRFIWGLAMKYTPTIVKKTEVTLSECYATRLKGFYYINASPAVETTANLIKKALKPKVSARIHVFPEGDYESLYKYVPKSILPKDYGGEERSMTELAELWRQKIDEKRDWFLEQERIMVDERLRPGPAIDGDDLFGFSGSFRKLDVD